MRHLVHIWREQFSHSRGIIARKGFAVEVFVSEGEEPRMQLKQEIGMCGGFLASLHMVALGDNVRIHKGHVNKTKKQRLVIFLQMAGWTRIRKLVSRDE